MLSPLRNRFGIPGVISVIALVFAMLGGAYAASDNSGSGDATASAKAKKGPRGPRGPKGPAGPAGAQGSAGSAGAKGDTGAAGSNGTNGKDGTNGTNGTNGKSVVTGTATSTPAGECPVVGGTTVEVEGTPASKKKICNGKEGEPGEPWTVGGTLPSEATETGVWQFISNGEVEQFLPISFPIPLSAADAESITLERLAKGIGPTANCPGSPEEPQAEPGFLCTYVSAFASNFHGNPNTAYKPLFAEEEEEEGVATGGTLLYWESPGAGNYSTGSFAITAP